MPASLSVDSADRIIHGFYDAALEPDRWQGALDALGDLLGGSAIGMTVQSKTMPSRTLAYSRLDPACTAIMAERYFTADTNPMVAVMAGLPPSIAMAREQVKSDKEYFGSGLYNDVFRPQGLVHAAVACAHRSSDCFVPLGIFRRSTQSELGTTEYALLKSVLPHLEKAVQVYLRIGRLSSAQLAMGDALQRLPFGIIFLDVQGRVWSMNLAAERILAQADGLSLRDGNLEAATSAEGRALRSLIASALSVSCGSGLSAGGAIPLSRPSMARRLTVLVAPLSAETDLLGARPGAIVFVSDPEHRTSAPENVFARMFGLTPAQSRITSLLVSGLTVGQAADHMGIKASTARAHVKSIFAKTDTSRQSELVRLILTSAASIALGPSGNLTEKVGHKAVSSDNPRRAL